MAAEDQGRGGTKMGRTVRRMGFLLGLMSSRSELNGPNGPPVYLCPMFFNRNLKE